MPEPNWNARCMYRRADPDDEQLCNRTLISHSLDGASISMDTYRTEFTYSEARASATGNKSESFTSVLQMLDSAPSTEKNTEKSNRSFENSEVNRFVKPVRRIDVLVIYSFVSFLLRCCYREFSEDGCSRITVGNFSIGQATMMKLREDAPSEIIEHSKSNSRTSCVFFGRMLPFLVQQRSRNFIL